MIKSYPKRPKNTFDYPQKSPGFVQKQPPEVFPKRRCPSKVLKFHRKTPMLESKKETPAIVFSCEICEIFRNIYFEEHLRKTAFICLTSKYYSQ